MVLQTSLLLVLLLASLAVVTGSDKKDCTLKDISLYYLIPGAVGIGVVSSVISILVTYFCMKFCKGKKKKKEKEEANDDEVSLQYASLQNLSVKEGHAVKRHENEGEQKTCYASVADIRKEIHTMDDKDVDAIDHAEIP